MSCWCHALFWYINTCVISGSPYLCLWVDLSKEICALTDPIIPSPMRRGSFSFTWDHPLSCSLPASMYHDWLGFFFSLNRFLDRNVFSLEAAGWERSCLFGNEYCPRTLDLRAAIFFSFLSFFLRPSLFFPQVKSPQLTEVRSRISRIWLARRRRLFGLFYFSTLALRSGLRSFYFYCCCCLFFAPDIKEF